MGRTRESGPGTRTEIVLAGVGGQGLVYMGRLLGRAAVEQDRHAVQTQSYGVASRGGFTKSEVIISGTPIAAFTVERPGAVLALTEEAHRRYSGSLPRDAVLVYDADAVSSGLAGGEVGLPLTSTARRLGLMRSYNVMALGAFVVIADILPPAAVRKLLTGKNLEAFDAGVSLAPGKE
ncbi:MAG: 2-oxoacid:acceptor oxidoreductase family protein [Bacillota bacterium]